MSRKNEEVCCLDTSVLLPAYNEAETIEAVVKAFYNEICQKLPADLIVAEDGSTDGTKEILDSLKDELPVLVLSDHNRRGYAKGVSDALRSCSSSWVFFSDSDGQYLPSYFWDLWKRREGYDMIIGRKMDRKEGLHRAVLAGGFHRIVNRLFGLELHDSDCGYRLIRKEVIDAVIGDVKFLEYSFWAEFTVRACLTGFRIRETPISHSDRTHGDSRIYEWHRIPTIVLKQLVGLARLYKDVRRR